MPTVQWLEGLFESIDRKDTTAFVEYLSDDVLFQFGNASPIKGKQSAAEAVGAFFQSVKAIKHQLVETWHIDDTFICRGIVSYTRLNSKVLAVPFVNIIKVQSGLAYEYLIYVDVSPLASEA